MSQLTPSMDLGEVLPIIRGIVRRFEPSDTWVWHDDLMSAGIKGWMKAREIWDEAKGWPFHGFASSYIRWEVIEALRRITKRKRLITISADTSIYGEGAETIMDTTADETAENGLERMLRIEQAKRLRALVWALPYKEMAVVHELFYEDLPQHEVARRREISQGAVSQRLKKALKALRSAIEQEGLAA